MKATFSILALTAALAVPAFAQRDEPPRRDRPAQRTAPASDVPKGAPAVLATLDRNRDGKLDQSEIDMAVVALRRLDRDRDGTVTAEEMVASPQRRPEPGAAPDRAQRRAFVPDFAEMDADGDGKVSKEEAPERMRERFAQMDRNDDGFLDKEEQELIAQFIRERVRNAAGGAPRRDSSEGGAGETEKPKRPPLEQ